MKDGPHFAVGDRVWVRPIYARKGEKGGKERYWTKATVVKLIPPKLTGEKYLQHEYWMYRVKFDGESVFDVLKVSQELEETIKLMNPLDRMAEIQ